MAVDPSFPCTLVIDVPLPTARLASVALKALSVDKELSPSVRRSFSVQSASGEDGEDGKGNEKTVLRTTYEATTNRMLRVSVNAFLDSVGLVLEVMEGLDVTVLEEASADADAEADANAEADAESKRETAGEAQTEVPAAT